MSNIVMRSDSFAEINGNEVYIDTIYGDPRIIGDQGYYIYSESENEDSTYYDYARVHEVFNLYLSTLRSGTEIKLRDFEDSLKETLTLQDFEITFNAGGWGWKPVANGIELCESFRTKEKAIEWLKGRSIRFERQFAKASYAWDNMDSDR